MNRTRRISHARRGRPRITQLTQCQIARRHAASDLSGRAARLGPYAPVVAFYEDGPEAGQRITDTCAARLAPSAMPRTAAHRHADTDRTPVDTRQRRRAAAREAAFRGVDTARLPRRRRRAAARDAAKGAAA